MNRSAHFDVTRPLRIVHVLRAPVGGLFRHVLDLGNEQIARGHKVGIIADSLTGGERGDAQLAELEPLLALGLLRLPMRRLPDWSDIAALAQVNRRLSEVAPDVVHGHGSKGGLYARLSGLPSRAKIARAYTPHGGSLNYNPGTLSHRFFMRIEALLAWRTDLQLFESGYIAERYHELVGEPRGLERIIRNGIGPSEMIAVAPREDAADFLYVGEFRSVKGLDTLIDAFGLIGGRTQRRPTLAMVGDGPDLPVLIERAKNKGVADQIVVHKRMPAREAFALGRIMVVPSRAESLPYIVLEAAGARLPLVATNVGGMGEIFGPYRDRLIAADDPEILSAAQLAALDEDPAAQKTKVTELADYVFSHFAAADMVDKIIAGYRDALAAKTPATALRAPSTPHFPR